MVSPRGDKTKDELEDPLAFTKKTFWDQENNIFINKLNFICKNFEETQKDVS
jgi:hypothetical protein